MTTGPESIQIARLEEQFSAMRLTMQNMTDEMRAAREAAEASMKDLRDELALVQRQLTEARGGWKTLMLIGGAVGTLAAAWGWISAHVRIQ